MIARPKARPDLTSPVLPVAPQASYGLAGMTQERTDVTYGILLAASILVPAAVGFAASKYGSYSPLKSAFVTVGLAVASTFALDIVGVGVLASERYSPFGSIS